MRPPRNPRKLQKTVKEIEAILAERFGVPQTRVVVRGVPPDWTASLLAGFPGNAERKAKFWTLAYNARAEIELKGD